MTAIQDVSVLQERPSRDHSALLTANLTNSSTGRATATGAQPARLLPMASASANPATSRAAVDHAVFSAQLVISSSKVPAAHVPSTQSTTLRPKDVPAPQAIIKTATASAKNSFSSQSPAPTVNISIHRWDVWDARVPAATVSLTPSALPAVRAATQSMATGSAWSSAEMGSSLPLKAATLAVPSQLDVSAVA